MKIAIVSLIYNPVGPAYPGGMEVFNYNLSSELSRRGHKVVLFASGDSETKAQLFPICKKSLFHSDLDPSSPQNMQRIIYLENQAYLRAMEYIFKNNFDIVHHNHLSILPEYIGFKMGIPQVLTIHLIENTNVTLNQDLIEFFPKQRDIAVISVSKTQQKLLNKLNFFANVYNGINLEDFTFNRKRGDYFVWLGRIAPSKGTEEAIKIAIKAGFKLKVAGDKWVGKGIDQYFNRLKKNYFGHKLIEYVGPADKKLRNELLGGALAFISPINWEESFGLVVPEANATGTPAITFNRGAMPELVRDGVNGFLVKPGDIDGMVKVVKKIYGMPPAEYLKMRRNCRKHVEEDFTLDKMVDGYENIYQKFINQSLRSK